MNILLNNVAKYVSLNESEQEIFLSYFKQKFVEKKKILLHEGQVCKGVAFVTTGILRSYSVDKDGFEHVMQFAPHGWWMADMQSFIRQEPARLFIDALENTDYLFLLKKDWDVLLQEIPALEKFFRIITENALIATQCRLVDTLSLPAKERYKHFCEQYPSLIGCLPQKQIASYIGVTPEFLSKMLREKIS